MKLLLTSAGITNDTIRQALLALLGKPIEESRALLVPTAIYTYPEGSGYAWEELKELGELGWKAFGVLELTALPSLPEESWFPAVQEADALIVGGGNGFYLSYWMHESGLANRLPELLSDTVYVGVSAGSAIVTASIHVNREELEKTGVYHDDEYDETGPPKASLDKTLNLVDFTLRPHMNADYFPTASLSNMQRWAQRVEVPLYAIDDQTAIKVIDGDVEVVSEGQWKRFEKASHSG